MNTFRITLAILLGLGGGIQAVPLDAAPLDLAQVSLQATWVAHMDFDAIRGSKVIQNAYKGYVATNKELELQLGLLRAVSGMDITKDLHGITVYGRKLGRNDGVAIVHANVNQNLLEELVRKTADYAAADYRSYRLHSWTDAKGKKDERRVAGTFHRPSVMVFAPGADELKVALDVLDSKLPSLAGKVSPLAAPVPEGAMVIIRAVALAESDLPFKSPLIKECETLSISLGEHQGDVFVAAQLAAKSAETAAQVQSILDGLRSLAELQRRDDPETVHMIKRFKVSVADKTVRVEFHAPADEVWSQIEKDAGRGVSPAAPKVPGRKQ